MDLDAKLFEITAVDTTNQTVTVGSALIDIALDANVVHNSGAETVGGIKSFSDDTYIKSLNFTNEVPSPSSSSSSIMPIIVTITYGDSSPSVQARLNLRVTADGVKSLYPHENNAYSLGLTSRSFSDFYSYHGYFRGQQQNDEYSSNARTNLTLLANRDTLGTSGVIFDTFRENTSQGTGSHILGVGIKENSVRYEGCRFSWWYDDDNNGYVFALRPTTQGTNQPIKYELGNSLSKWTTINGLNPSSLGMPDLNSAVDISGYLTNAGTVTPSEYIPPVNGWMCIGISADSPPALRVFTDSGFDSYSYTEQSEVGGSGGVYSRYGSIAVPVVAGVTYKIIVMPSTMAIITAKLFPCLGNV